MRYIPNFGEEGNIMTDEKSTDNDIPRLIPKAEVEEREWQAYLADVGVEWN
jgi:hypothetical protein